MGRTYSKDLRERISNHVAAGHSCRDAARRFGVSPSCAIKLMQHVGRVGTIMPVSPGTPAWSGQACAAHGEPNPVGGGEARHQHA